MKLVYGGIAFAIVSIISLLFCLGYSHIWYSSALPWLQGKIFLFGTEILSPILRVLSFFRLKLHVKLEQWILMHLCKKKTGREVFETRQGWTRRFSQRCYPSKKTPQEKKKATLKPRVKCSQCDFVGVDGKEMDVHRKEREKKLFIALNAHLWQSTRLSWGATK